ncbi:S8 family serine peptidase [Agrilutibacter solisilvae]|uniref:S8 family serine peptidase n=1 Tax=Agrilutibacter solisilvae TaxID=2763317 RepID=A0A974Y030_9GAMM|nr:S8 family serine peptidase [Lysobacter solisilvae]QSX77985.1 S8 family serine peptidase [Lysobacter solisilvae]
MPFARLSALQVSMLTVAGAAALWGAIRVAPEPGQASSRGAAAQAAVAPRTSGERGSTARVPTRQAGLPDRGPRRVHLVFFREVPLATFQGSKALGSPRTAPGGRLDPKSAPARAYVKQLQRLQGERLVQLEQAIGRPLRVTRRMQHAVNGVTVALTDREAAVLRRQPGVAMVEASRLRRAHTDVGPRLIGSEIVWNTGVRDTVGATVQRAKGEGVVVAVLDSGINWGSPSFAARGADGYTVVNPLGAGQYLGTCAPGGPDYGRCNAKLIGGYDFVCNAQDPISMTSPCTDPNAREEPGFGDTHSHGTHVASTAAGSVRDISYLGVPLRISGVAPHANLIALDICYTDLTENTCWAPSEAMVAAVNQVVADGVADVINLSFSGGTLPSNTAESLALLNAVAAGVFVAGSAGNEGPTPNTLSRREPWITTVAAAQHGRASFDFRLAVNGPGVVPDALKAVPLVPAAGGTDLRAAIAAGTALKLIAGSAENAGFDGTSDGCAPYAAGTFTGRVALIRRGTCYFSQKLENAQAAGATAVVFANHEDAAMVPTVAGTTATIPAFIVSRANGNALRDFSVARGGMTAGVPYPATASPNTVDALAAFSSRGPGASVLKPDVAAPGVAILAAFAGTTLTGYEQAIGMMSGTSMASPHVAGAGALLRQLRPTWTPSEMKSALMLTSRQSVLNEDGVTPANAWAGGAGRVQVDLAARSTLVLDETSANFQMANPNTGGDPSRLNVASIEKDHCPGTCTFVRRVRNTMSLKHSWLLQLEGIPGKVTPHVLVLKPGQVGQITITLDNSSQPADGSWRFGQLRLSPNRGWYENQVLPKLHMPIALSKYAAARTPAKGGALRAGRDSVVPARGVAQRR